MKFETFLTVIEQSFKSYFKSPERLVLPLLLTHLLQKKIYVFSKGVSTFPANV